MHIAGSYDLDAPADRIWPLIFDPAELLQLIPGCEQIGEISPGEYHGRLNFRVAAVGGTFQTTLKIVDQQPPSYARFEGEVVGPGGIVKGQVHDGCQGRGIHDDAAVAVVRQDRVGGRQPQQVAAGRRKRGRGGYARCRLWGKELCVRCGQKRGKLQLRKDGVLFERKRRGHIQTPGATGGRR